MAPRSPGRKHVFISYVHEDKSAVDRIEAALTTVGVTVWRDTADLWPGRDWRVEIRRAITEDALVFVACFSEASEAKVKTYRNEELVLAVDEYRKRNPAHPWLFPVRLSDCELPSHDLGAGRTLDSLQRVDLVNGSSTDLPRLVLAITSAVEALGTESELPAASPASISSDFVKSALLDPAQQIALEDHVMDVANQVASEVSDPSKCPTRFPEDSVGIEEVRFVARQASRYLQAVEPLMRILIVAGTWGQQHHNPIWQRSTERVVNAAAPPNAGGQTALLDLRRYLVLPLLYSVGISSIERSNFGPLAAVALDASLRGRDGTQPLASAVHPGIVFQSQELAANVLALESARDEPLSDDEVEQLRTRGRKYTPISIHLENALRPLFTELIADDAFYEATFDRFEVLMGALILDANDSAIAVSGYRPGPWYGSFTGRDKYIFDQPLENKMRDEVLQTGAAWAGFEAALFGGDLDRAKKAFDELCEGAARARRDRH